MSHEMVATLDAKHLKTNAPKRTDQLPPPYARQTRHSLDSDALDPNELVPGGQTTLDLQAKLDGFTNALHEPVQGTSLSVTTLQFRNARDIVPGIIAFHNHTEDSLPGLSH